MAAAQSSIEFEFLRTHDTAWTPDQVQVTLNARCDARIVPSPASPQGARVDYAHVVVLDNFFDAAQQTELLDLITVPGWEHHQAS